MNTAARNAAEFLTTKELAERYEHKLSVRTIQNWRNLQQGPKFLKLGGRVLYRLSDIEEWEKQRAVNGTCQYQK